MMAASRISLDTPAQGDIDWRKTHKPKHSRHNLDLSQILEETKSTIGCLLSPVTGSPSSPNMNSGHSRTSSRSLLRKKTAESSESGLSHAILKGSKSLRRSTRSGKGKIRASASDDDLVKQNKKHIRRPLKGTQNWFDSYLSSDGEDDYIAQGPTLHDASPAASLRDSAFESQQGKEVVDDQAPAFHEPGKMPFYSRNVVSTDDLGRMHPRVRHKQQMQSLHKVGLSEHSVLALSSSSGSEDEGLRLPATRYEPRAAVPRRPGLGVVGGDSFRSFTTFGTIPIALSENPVQSPDADSPQHPATLAERGVHELSETSHIHDTYQAGPAPTSHPLHTNDHRSTSRKISVTEDEMLILDIIRRRRATLQPPGRAYTGPPVSGYDPQALPPMHSGYPPNDPNGAQTGMQHPAFRASPYAAWGPSSAVDAGRGFGHLQIPNSTSLTDKHNSIHELQTWRASLNDTTLPGQSSSTNPTETFPNDQDQEESYTGSSHSDPQTNESDIPPDQPLPSAQPLDPEPSQPHPKSLPRDTIPPPFPPPQFAPPPTISRAIRGPSRSPNGVPPAVLEEISQSDGHSTTASSGNNDPQTPPIQRASIASSLGDAASVASWMSGQDSTAHLRIHADQPKLTYVLDQHQHPAGNLITSAPMTDSSLFATLISAAAKPPSRAAESPVHDPAPLTRGLQNLHLTPSLSSTNSSVASHSRFPVSSSDQMGTSAVKPFRRSMSSNNSAGEDVLAAWAQLGGGSDCLDTAPPTSTPQQEVVSTLDYSAS